MTWSLISMMLPTVQILYTTACCDRQPTGDGSFLPLQVYSWCIACKMQCLTHIRHEQHHAALMATL